MKIFKNKFDKYCLAIFLLAPFITQGTNYLLHKNPGCPMNSLCSKKSGQKFMQWKKAVSNKSAKILNFKLTKGLFPFQIWAKDLKNTSTTNSILWNSNCPEHNNKNILMGKIFIQRLTDLPSNFFTDFLTRKRGNSYQTTLTPRGESPTYLTRNKAVYTLAEMNNTYELSIDNKLQLHFEPLATKFYPSYSEKCTTAFLNAGNKIKNFQLPLTHYCRSVWNRDTKSYETIMISTYCP